MTGTSFFHGRYKLAEENVSTEAQASGSKNPLLIILVLINTIAVGAIGFFQYKSSQKVNAMTETSSLLQQQLAGAGGAGHGEEGGGGHGGAAGAESSAKLEGMMYPLEPFTANLAQGDGPKRYIRVSMVLKFTNDTKKEEVDARKPQISDVIISMLNAKKPEDLLKKEGKEYLKEEIKNAVNSFLIDGHLEDIFYVGFQIN